MLFSISESSFLSMNKLRLRVLRKKNDRRANRVGRLLEKKEILINTLLIANDLANILLSSIITAICMELFGSRGVGYATFIVTLFLLVFGEITPKTISTRNPDAIAYGLSMFVKIVVHLLHPIVYIFTFVSRLILKIRGIDIERKGESYSEEDIKSFIDAGSESGVIEAGKKNMMKRVFKFADIEAQDIMIPRTSIVALNPDVTFNQVMELAQRTRLSYFPVYLEDIDDIIGVLYLKDLLKFVGEDGENQPETFDVLKIMRKPLFIPGSNKMSSVQQLLRETHNSVAIVIDEYSGTDGIITKEDISAEIFGHNDSIRPWRTKDSLNTIDNTDEFEIDGLTLLVDMKEMLGFEIKSNINETLGGWIIERLGRLALPYDSITYNGYVFTVEAIYRRRIKTIRIEKIKEEGGKND